MRYILSAALFSIFFMVIFYFGTGNPNIMNSIFAGGIFGFFMWLGMSLFLRDSFLRKWLEKNNLTRFK